jgi:hypothetical protein
MIDEVDAVVDGTFTTTEGPSAGPEPEAAASAPVPPAAAAGEDPAGTCGKHYGVKPGHAQLTDRHG